YISCLREVEMGRLLASECSRMIRRGGSGDHTGLDYWHGMLPNEDTANLLKNSGQFLLRALERNGANNIILSVRWGKNIVNTVISKCANGGYECQGTFFTSVKDIVDLYQVRKRQLNINGVKVTLDMPVRRKRWELRHKMVKLEKELGSGSYGVVYRGTLTFPAKKPFVVAVKELTEMGVEASNALWKEARVMQMYDHPNVVKLYGVANDYMPYYLVMELVLGGSVDDYLAKKGSKVSVKARTQILYEASIGLEYLHSKDCLHRDIACRNLLIDRVVKVADFGMTRHTTNYKIDPNKPMNLRWLAPEVYESAIVNKSTDVYAFGVTMYECFTQPYSIPYADWKADKVYDKVVNNGYRLKPPDLMPRKIGGLMEECIGPEESRPTFTVVAVCLKAFLKNG
uniref:Tyrosine-protein kinase n=1 Tax=Parascaris univalens TaxID=6257 RepID=A0A915A096_PARUN